MRLSAIIPTYREAARIAETVHALRRECDEVVVCDADSQDGTSSRAAEAGAVVVSLASAGRGPQLNRGAEAATGDVLVFVHADTTIPTGFGAAMVEAIRAGALGGNFRLRYWPPGAAARLFTWANHLRRRWFGIYYGDSCIFVRRDVFDGLGGFPASPILEDYAFARRLEALGPTAYLEPEVRTSTRRFEDRPLRTLATWTVIQTAFSLGVSPARLAVLYRHIR